MKMFFNVLLVPFVRHVYEDAFHALFNSPICITLKPFAVAVPN